MYEINSYLGNTWYDEVQTNSVIYSFNQNISLALPCNRTVLLCVPNPGATATWQWQDSNSSPGAIELHLCTYQYHNGMYCCCFSNVESVYQCIQSYSNIDISSSSRSTLQFTYSIYNLNEMCQTQDSFITVTSTTTYPMPNSSYSGSTTVSPVQSSTVPHYTGIGLLVATNLLTIIALISSCVYIFCQRKKSKL